MLAVALLAEGVDRNIIGTDYIWDAIKSPSSRRAWIEISTHRHESYGITVALLAEGVDRNMQAALSHIKERGRPPRGGRG